MASVSITRIFSSPNKWGFILGGLIIGGMLFFEGSNYISTNVALVDILGGMALFGIRWSTMLSLAFCFVDFAGIARIFTPEQGREEPTWVWYLFAAWFMAAAFDALLTWWSVNVAIYNSQSRYIATVPALRTIFPIGVALGELAIRISLINVVASTGERIFSMARRQSSPRASNTIQRPAATPDLGARNTNTRVPTSVRPGGNVYHPVYPPELVNRK